MSKYRKKPIVIEAFRWTGGIDQTEDPEWAVTAIKSGVIDFAKHGTPDCRMVITTLEGAMEATPGDYIIQRVKGELYPCKPDIFEMTYEEVVGDIKPTVPECPICGSIRPAIYNQKP